MKIAKRFRIVLMFVFFCGKLLNAQDSLQNNSAHHSKWSLSFSSGYAFGFGKTLIGGDYHYYADGLKTTTLIKSSYGQGIFSMLTATFNCSDFLGINFGCFSKIGTEQMVSRITNDYSMQTFRTTDKFNNQGMVSGISICKSEAKWNINFSSDFLLGIKAYGLQTMHDNVNQNAFTFTELYVWKYYGRLNLGWLNKLSISYSLNKRIGVGAEGFLLIDKYSPGKGKVLKYDVNGIDQRSTLTNQNAIYVNENAYNSYGLYPGQQIRPNFSFNAIGALLFIKYNF